MKIPSKLIYSTTLLLTSFVFGQTNNNDFEFSDYWKVSQNNTNLVISNGSIKNNTDASKDLDLEYYLVPKKGNTTKIIKDYMLPVHVNVGQLKQQSQSAKHVRVEVDFSYVNNLKMGDYNLVAVLKDKNTNQELGYKVFNENIHIHIDTESHITESSEYPSTPTTTINHVKRPKTKLSFSTDNDQIILNGEWRLDVDFQYLTVKLNGVNNDIVNNTLSDKNDLKLYIYFSENKHTKEDKFVEGYEILSTPLSPILSGGEYKNVKLDASITEYIPSGEYYPILLISEKDITDGNYKIKSFIQFDNKYTL